MNIGQAVGKIMPLAKKVGPIVFGAVTGAMGAISSQKEAKRLKNIEDRLATLEALKKD